VGTLHGRPRGNLIFIFIFLFLLTITGDGWLPLQETQTFFVDDPGKHYRQRGRATQAKGLETLDQKVEVEGPSESPPPSTKEDQPQLTPMGEKLQSERKIELCTPNIVDLPIINLQDAGRPFKIKVTTIRMVQHSPFNGGVKTRLGSIDEELYEGILFADQDSEFAQQD
jgi:hypothetical protein